MGQENEGVTSTLNTMSAEENARTAAFVRAATSNYPEHLRWTAESVALRFEERAAVLRALQSRPA
jgi:hypothetical protein